MSAPEGRAYGPLTATLGALLLAMGLALSVEMIAAVVGPFELVGSARAGAPALGVWLPASALRAGPTEARRRVRAWRAVLAPRVAVREGGSLAALAAGGAAALAVSDARGIGAAELEALSEFVRSGGSAIVCGPVAVRGPAGEWRGTEAMARLLGVAMATLPREASHALEAARRGPLSAGLVPRQRLALLAEEGVATRDPAAELVFAGDPGSEPARGARGASLRRELGSGRLAWLGACPDRSAAGATTPGGDFARLAAATFAWAAREPYAEVLRGASGEAATAARSAPLAADLAAEMRRLGPRRHLLEVTNRGGAAVREGVVRVHLNAPIERVALERTVLQQEAARPSFRKREAQLDLRLPELAPGRSLAYTLDLDPAAAPSSAPSVR
jgi:hypothetical protein